MDERAERSLLNRRAPAQLALGFGARRAAALGGRPLRRPRVPGHAAPRARSASGSRSAAARARSSTWCCARACCCSGVGFVAGGVGAFAAARQPREPALRRAAPRTRACCWARASCCSSSRSPPARCPRAARRASIRGWCSSSRPANDLGPSRPFPFRGRSPRPRRRPRHGAREGRVRSRASAVVGAAPRNGARGDRERPPPLPRGRRGLHHQRELPGDARGFRARGPLAPGGGRAPAAERDARSRGPRPLLGRRTQSRRPPAPPGRRQHRAVRGVPRERRRVHGRLRPRRGAGCASSIASG